ncbi:MAG: hypothetical protein WKF28_03700, partial [Rubrobacteraceae bacterium]
FFQFLIIAGVGLQPLLRMGQIAHVDKRAVFGLGRYRLLRDPDIRSLAYDPAHGPGGASMPTSGVYHQ